MKSTRFSVTLPKKDWEALAKLKNEKGETISHWIRRAVNALLDKINKEETKNEN